MKKHIMVDLETLSTEPNAAIVSIGAVVFDMTTKKLGEQFYAQISLESSMNAGLDVKASTILWWVAQTDKARLEICGKQNRYYSLEEALLMFTKWTESLSDNPNDIYIMGNGAAFDNVVLRSAYKAVNRPAPWPYANDECYRTLKNMYATTQAARYGEHHNALDDAITQAHHLMEFMQ